ncbi:hypothetical protein QBC36DRAFT_345097 [Triangularia setosa]|uniref:GATA-type domain-containing protein n=1 Tax=Triangularia setosa TaxID=2587417 RepID=A0AAN6W9I8_9PEZI|nr:hypothetical protein QBC36DRAFT_345097 [Podospora setosa]
MEAGDLGSRQSGIPTASSTLDHFDRRSREQRIDTSYREGQNMATATIISPSAPAYHQHHSSYNSGYPHSAPVTSIPGMISPVEPRRSAEDPEPTNNHRQSLPSISEVISGTKPGSFAPPVPQQMPPQNLPSPFSVASLTSGPPRSFEAGAEKNQSPRTLHPASSGYPRPDTLPAFSDPSRPALASRPAPPPLNTFSGPHQSSSRKIDSIETDQRPPQTQQTPLSAGHREQPPQQLPGLYSEAGRLPPGQLPLSAYPVSPRHSGAGFSSPYDSQRPPAYGEDSSEYMHHRLSDYKAALDKHYETYGYQDALQIVANSCRTGYNFAEAYVAAAREQGGTQPILSRMPTENEVSGLLNSLVLALKKLEEVREMIQRNRIQDERARDHGRKPEDEDVAMYNDGMKPAYSLNEVKKRRGRAAPPGRCHSCNRIDTPEWRRGPDGARTLCNACGLHYAKLERKRQLDQRSLRPKPSEDRS